MTQQPQYTQNVAEFVGQSAQQTTPLAQAGQFAEAPVQRGIQQPGSQMQSPTGNQSEAMQTNLQSGFVRQDPIQRAIEQQVVPQAASGQQMTAQQSTDQQAFGSTQQMAGGTRGTAGTTGAATPQEPRLQGQGVRAASAQESVAQGSGVGTVQQAETETAGQAPLQQTGIPPIDMIDGETKLSILVDIPGFEEDDIEIKLEGDLLRVVASERVRDLDETETMISQERPTAVRRQIQLPTPILADDAAASYEDGVLTVELPKDEEEAAVGKQIGIQ